MLKYLAADSNTDSRLFSEVIRPGAPLIKQAAAVDPEIQKCISGLKSTPGKIYILANALGAGEYYGSNMNGDFFEEKELNPPDGSTEYGYKTFLQSGVYRHHSNKDITKSYGTILCAAYNKAMHRVELVIEIDKKKCEDVGHADLWKRLEAGEKPAVSMGSKVPYDVCIICGNKSRTKDDYCTHAKEQLNQLLPDGRKVYVLNPRPKFFDISVVIIGADRVSYVMDKVAQARMPAILSSYLAVEEGLRDPLESITAKLKLATHGKSAELVKRLKATAAQVVTPGAKDEIDLPNGVLDGLARSGSLSKILTTTAASGIVLKPQEFQRIVLLLSNKPDMADRLSHGCGCFSPSAQIDRSISFGDSSSFSGGLADLLAPFLRDRSAFEPVVSRRILVIKTAQARRPLTYVREPLLDKIAAAYNGYRAELLEKIGSIVANITERDVHLLAEVRKELFEGMFSGRSLAIKTASAPVPLALLGAIPLAYFYGAHTGGSTEQDKAADSFIAKHPVLAISVLAGLARLAVKAESSGAAEKVVSKLLNR